MRIGIITDIHENVKMLERMLSLAEKHGCDALACLGDIVGFDRHFHQYPETKSAHTCLDLVRSHCQWVVAGNHDLFAARKFPGYANGFSFPDNWFDLDPRVRKEISGGKVWPYENEVDHDLKDEDIAYIRSLPESAILAAEGFNCHLSHYFFPNLSGSSMQYFKNQRQLRDLWQWMKAHSLTYAFCGHAHPPFAEFAYPRHRSLFKAWHAIPSQQVSLSNEMTAVLLPPLSGDKGKSGFTIFDTDNRQISIIYTH